MLSANQLENMITACIPTEVNIISNFYYSAIACAAPSIANGAHNCDSTGLAFGGTCAATCNAGYSGGATITCGDSNGDGTGDFDQTVTCSGKLFFFANFTVTSVFRTSALT